MEKIWRRCGVDVDKMWSRCGEDVEEMFSVERMWRRCGSLADGSVSCGGQTTDGSSCEKILDRQLADLYLPRLCNSGICKSN